MLTSNKQFNFRLSEYGEILRDNYTAMAISEAYVDKTVKSGTKFPDIIHLSKETFDESIKKYGWQYDQKYKDARHSMKCWKTTDFGKISEVIPADLLVYTGNEIDDLYNVVKNAEMRITKFSDEICFSSVTHGTILSEELYCAGWIWGPNELTQY